MTHKKNAGFTLIELMIVVAIIAIIASVAIPKLMAARLAANESAAISTLRSLSSSQAQIQSSAAIDTDADGGGEYGYFAELAGTFPLRISAAGVAAAGAVNADELVPAVLSSAFGTVNATSQVSRSGYLFQVFLPAATVGGATAGIAEDPTTGGKAAGFPDSDNCEVLWCCYAWPISQNQTGNRSFFINQEGDLMQTPNRTGSPIVYSGTGSSPTFDAAYSPAVTANSMGSAMANGIAGNDGNTWVPVQ